MRSSTWSRRPDTNLETFQHEEWAAEVAGRLASRVRPGRRLCLAAGNTPTPVYAELARTKSLKGLTIFLLDEFGGLPDDDPGRCHSMLKRDLLTRCNGRPIVHTPDVDASDPEHAADRYGDLIDSGGLHLAVVGLGPNGHIGMNEPGATSDLSTRVVTLDPETSANAGGYGATITPTWGITVGLSELLEADEIWVLVTGTHKAEILQRTIDGPVGPDVPASFLAEHPNCRFLVDEAAASRLRG